MEPCNEKTATELCGGVQGEGRLGGIEVRQDAGGGWPRSTTCTATRPAIEDVVAGRCDWRVHFAGREARHRTRSYGKGDARQDRQLALEVDFLEVTLDRAGIQADRTYVTCRRRPRSETSLSSARGHWMRDSVATPLAKRHFKSRKKGRARSESMTITFAIRRLGKRGSVRAGPTRTREF
jgi:hypothetical protein